MINVEKILYYIRMHLDTIKSSLSSIDEELSNCSNQNISKTKSASICQSKFNMSYNQISSHSDNSIKLITANNAVKHNIPVNYSNDNNTSNSLSNLKNKSNRLNNNKDNDKIKHLDTLKTGDKQTKINK